MAGDRFTIWRGSGVRLRNVFRISTIKFIQLDAIYSQISAKYNSTRKFDYYLTTEQL